MSLHFAKEIVNITTYKFLFEKVMIEFQILYHLVNDLNHLTFFTLLDLLTNSFFDKLVYFLLQLCENGEKIGFIPKQKGNHFTHFIFDDFIIFHLNKSRHTMLLSE